MPGKERQKQTLQSRSSQSDEGDITQTTIKRINQRSFRAVTLKRMGKAEGRILADTSRKLK